MIAPTSSTETVDDRVLARLRGAVRGLVLTPENPKYESARHIWNGAIDRRPGVIVRCSGTADVVTCVTVAREHGLLLAIRSGGHNVAGSALCDGGMVIDLSGLKGIRVDPDARTARMQPGVTNGDFDHETQLFGLSTTTGIASTTGLAGLTLGGGLGWTMRKFGLTADTLLSADVVTASGEVMRTSERENPDLFWAIRGGGSNFGVVTSFEFRLQPLGPTVLAGPLVYPAEQAREVLRFYRDFVSDAPDEVTTILNLRAAPPAPWLPPELHGKPVIIVIACYAGPVEEGERVLQPLKAFGSPAVDLLVPKPYLAHQTMFDASVPAGWRYYWKSHYLGDLTDACLDTIIEHAWASSSPRSYTLFPLCGGAVSRVPEDAMACGNRAAAHVININGVWTEPAEDAEHKEWARRFAVAVEPYSTGGVYVNFLGEEGEARIRAAYGDDKYARLSALKARHDPTNLFRVNQNIKPAIPS